MPPSKQREASSSSSPTTATTATRKPKRKRVSRACDQCFLKKDRCDGLQPICTFCSSLGRACTYDRPERKRGPTQGLRPRLEQRIAALETVLGFVLEQQRGEPNVDRLKSATEEEKDRWRKEGWWKSATRKQLEAQLGLGDDLVSATPAAKKEEDDEYSDVDLSLPPTHQPPDTTSSIPPPSNRDDEISSDENEADILALPLLSSGKGGSSLNRGLVPRGADPNAALGGFEIEFGGNQTDIDWVRRFVPPPRQQRDRDDADD